MDSGPAPKRGASRNDGDGPRAQMGLRDAAQGARLLRMRSISQQKSAPVGALSFHDNDYFAGGLAGAPPGGALASSFLRVSSARFCNSSCNFFWAASNSF